MKALLAACAGFVLTLAIFGSGLVFATWLLAAKPVEAGPSPDVVDLWSRKPRAVNQAAQDLERLPARPVPADQKVASGAEAGPQVAQAHAAGEDAAPDAIDVTTTASVQPDEEQQAADEQAPEEQQPASSGLPAEHVAWCFSRYRSYRESDNSYAPYSGGRRPCVSPYLDTADAGQYDSLSHSGDASYVEAAGDASAQVDYIAADDSQGLQMTSQHVEYCFSRYRSYRPEDNSYQPYGGGPRRQCQ